MKQCKNFLQNSHVWFKTVENNWIEAFKLLQHILTYKESPVHQFLREPDII